MRGFVPRLIQYPLTPPSADGQPVPKERPESKSAFVFLQSWQLCPDSRDETVSAFQRSNDFLRVRDIKVKLERADLLVG